MTLKNHRGLLRIITKAITGITGTGAISITGCMAHARRKFDEALKALPKICSYNFQLVRVVNVMRKSNF